MRKNLKKKLSLALALVLILGMLPISALANETQTAETVTAMEGLSIAYPYNTETVQLTGTPADRFDALTFESARGEVESAQMILTPNFAVDSFELTMNSLKNENGNIIPSGAFEVYTQHYVTVTGSSNAPNYSSKHEMYHPESGKTGWDGIYPDALIPQDAAIRAGENTIAAGNNQGVWVNLNVQDAAPGTYTGYATLTVNGSAMQIPVSVHIYDVKLPEQVHAKSSVGIWYDQLEAGEGHIDRKLADTYFDYVVSKRLMPVSAWSLTKWNDSFADYAATYLAVSPEISAYYLHIEKNEDGTVNTEALKDTLTTLINKNIQLAKFGSNVDLFQKAYFSWIYDEPRTDAEYAFANTITAQLDAVKGELAPMLDAYPSLKASFMNLRHIITSPNPTDKTYADKVTGNWFWQDTFIDDDYGNISLTGDSYIYCPQFQWLNTEDQRNLYAGESELWWYGCCHPVAPYPTYHLNTPLVSARVIDWMMYDYGIDGNLYWSVNAWYQYDYQYNEYSGHGTPGDGVLLLPGSAYGVDGPIGTIRLENIREGNEDYEYLWMLENEFGITDISAYTANLYSGVIPNTDTSIYYNNRKALLRDLEELNIAKNGATVVQPDETEDTVDVMAVGESRYYFEQSKQTNGSQEAWMLLNAPAGNWTYPEITLDKDYDVSKLKLVADIKVTGVSSFRLQLSHVNGQWLGADVNVNMNQWNTVEFDLESICGSMGISQINAFSFGLDFTGATTDPAFYIDNIYLVYTPELPEDPNDLLANTLWHDSIGADLNTNCLQTCGTESTRSWNLSGNGGGWPHLQFQLDQGYDMTNKYLTFDIKAVNAMGQLVVFEVKDSGWGNLANGSGDHLVVQFETDQWVTVQIDMDALAASGKTMNDVQILRMYFTFEGYTGEKNIYIDNLRLECKHSYESVVTPPTETDQGYTTHTCVHCGDSYMDSYTDPVAKVDLNDLLANALWSDSIDANLNTESTVVYGDSVKSWNLYGTGGGWPHLQFQLDQGYDMTNKYLTFDIKAVNAMGQLVVFEVKDSGWGNLANGSGDHLVVQFETDQWVTVQIDMDSLAAAGKTMSDVQILRMYFTFEGYTGEKNIYIDNLRLVEKTNVAPDKNGYLVLSEDLKANLSLDKDLYVDLNGFNMTGTINTNGYNVYGMDSATNNYTCGNMGYFSCVDAQGNAVVPQSNVKTDLSGDMMRYATIATENGYTFHRFYVGITKQSLAPSVTGVGYKAEFYADEMLRSQVSNIGYDLWLEDGKAVSRSADFKNQLTLRVKNYDVANYGETNLYATACITIAGEKITSSEYSLTLRQVVEAVNANWESYTETQKNQVREMVKANEASMSGWSVENILAANSTEEFDLLANVIWHEAMDATLNTESTVVYGDSIKSWNLYGTGGGWPHLQFQLDQGYDMTNKYLTFDIKAVNAMGQLVVFEVKDSGWGNLANGSGDHLVVQFETDQWVTVQIDMDSLAAAGKTMSDVQILRMYFTFEDYTGEKNIYIDNLRLEEKKIVATEETEQASDLLALATMEWGQFGFTDGHTYDNNCTDTVNGDLSLRSWAFMVEAGKGNWGKAQIKLADSVDMTGKKLAFDIKLVNTYSWMDVRLHDANWTEIGYWGGDIQNTAEWQTVIIDPATLGGSGDLSSLFLITFGCNNDTNKNLQQVFYIDNLRLIEA